MRDAMICVSVMLAIFLAWPMVFGSNEAAAVRAATVEATVPAARAAEAKLIRTSVRAAEIPPAKALESCFKRYEREYAMCGPTNIACRMKVADSWDLCEATGFWP
ncbi:hypothetical protein ABS767_15780 [Sphingomonas sp. ST-64]|uniref:Uncharacterized protein n=1 Tax=Sphingomonas plantiphila TaxID=3163295 RepID=A0ABW8YTF4_9SPHN